MDNFQEKYDILVKKYNTLLNENEKLKSILQQHGIAYPTEKVNNTETAFSSITFPPVNLSLDDKITLFRSFCVLILMTKTVLTDTRMTYWLSFLSARIGESHTV